MGREGAREMIDRSIEILHALPGRVRLRVAGLKRDPALAQELEGRIAGVSGDPARRGQPGHGQRPDPVRPGGGPPRRVRPAARPRAHRRRMGGRHPPDPPAARDGTPARGIADFFRELNRRVAARAGGLDLTVFLPLALFALGVRGLLGSEREKLAVPTWYDLLWFAFGTFLMLNRSAIEEDPGRRITAIDPTSNGR